MSINKFTTAYVRTSHTRPRKAHSIACMLEIMLNFKFFFLYFTS